MDFHQIAMSTAHLKLDLLLCGETGTGKDTLASHIHKISDRKGSFLGINCAAIPEALAESQLFGVETGAYTGVRRSRMGYIEAAQGGTLYLDEIDSMPLALQAKLLRVLETRGIERLGSTTFVPLDFRVIASAQRPLDELVEQGLFRRDLFFRLNVLTIQLPALRKRREQILPLFDQFTEAVAAHFERPVPELDSHLTQALLSHDWSGNIRELKSAAKRYVLGFPILGAHLVEKKYPVSGLRMQLKVIEKILINNALKRHKHSLDAVGLELDLPRRTLYQRMKVLGV
jgi:transcriptional regulator with PAS, ATPase and Fis domain